MNQDNSKRQEIRVRNQDEKRSKNKESGVKIGKSSYNS